jgi:hypothetical protein
MFSISVLISYTSVLMGRASTCWSFPHNRSKVGGGALLGACADALAESNTKSPMGISVIPERSRAALRRMISSSSWCP